MSAAAVPTEPAAVAAEVARLYPAVYRRFKASGRRVDGSELTARMLVAVQHLAGSGPVMVGGLADQLGLSRATTTELVDRLEKRGLVARVRDDRDRRRVIIWLTEAGRAGAAAHPRVFGNADLHRAVVRMRPVDRSALIRGLRALLAASEHDG